MFFLPVGQTPETVNDFGVTQAFMIPSPVFAYTWARDRYRQFRFFVSFLLYYSSGTRPSGKGVSARGFRISSSTMWDYLAGIFLSVVFVGNESSILFSVRQGSVFLFLLYGSVGLSWSKQNVRASVSSSRKVGPLYLATPDGMPPDEWCLGLFMSR